MRTRYLGSALAMAAVWAAPRAAAQVAPVNVSVQLLQNLETVYAADFTPYNIGQQPDFLSITLQNGSTQPQSIKLQLVIRQEQPRSVQLFTGTTRVFALSGGVRRLTNRDLANQNSDVVIDEFDVSSDAQDLNDQVLHTGRFPSGVYVFQVTVLRPTGSVLGTAQTRVELINPSRVELLSPGRPFGDNPEVLSTPAPRFQWTSDQGAGVLGASYRIRVVPAEGAASPEEAMQAFANWEATTNATTALYPGSVSAIPLEAGKTYAWQVTRDVRTSGGVVKINSPIYWFKMSGGERTSGRGDQRAGGEVGANLQLDQLARSLGLGQQLLGFRPTGQMSVDGKAVSSDNLEALLRAILAGEVAVHSITVR